MNCRAAAKVLGPWADGELPSPRREDVRDHVRACPACAAEVAALQALDEAASSIEAPPVGERQWEEAWEGIRTGLEAKPPRLQPRALAWPPVAAAALIVAGLIGFVLVLRQPGSPTAPPPDAPIARVLPTVTPAPELVPGLAEVELGESGGSDFMPVLYMAEDGSTVVWMAEAPSAL